MLHMGVAIVLASRMIYFAIVVSHHPTMTLEVIINVVMLQLSYVALYNSTFIKT